MRSSSSRGTSAAVAPWTSSRYVLIAPKPLLRRPARDLTISSAVAPPFRDASSSSSSSSFPAAEDASPFVIRAPKTDSEFSAIAALRAEAYYADQPGGGGRFVESYKKQFREQEARSLRERVAPRRRKKEGGFLNLKGGGGGSGGSGFGSSSGGGGVFGGVLGVLVGRATPTGGGASASSANSSASEGAEEGLLLPPECECLAAVEVPEEEEEGEGEEGGSDGNDNEESAPPPSPSPSVVLGALDLRPPSSAGGGHPAGVPLSDQTGCAVLNVAVHPSSRRRGVARALLRRASEVAQGEWGATALYTTVAGGNAGARALYADFGFVEVEAATTAGEEGSEVSPPPPTTLGRELLLRVKL